MYGTMSTLTEEERAIVGQPTLTRRTTSSHIHVVSAGNSQRNSRALSECQEELNNAVISHERRVEAPKTTLCTSRNTYHYRPSTRKEDGASFMYAHGRKMDFGTPSPCPTTVYGIGD